MELVARRTPERVLLIGADLRLDVEGPEEREGAAGDGGAREIEVERDLAASEEVDAARDMEEARQLGETVAVGLRRDRGELVAKVLRQHLPAPAGAACTR